MFACVGDITCSSRRGSCQWQQTMDLTTLSSELVQDWGPEACYSLGGGLAAETQLAYIQEVSQACDATTVENLSMNRVCITVGVAWEVQ